MNARTWIACALLAPAVMLAHAQSSSSSTSVTTTTTNNGSAQAAALRCGGVGNEDQQRIKAEAAQHGLLVTFATSSGAYLADADVEVLREGRAVVRGHCGGPLMLLDLAPAGSYEIVATVQGKTQRKTVQVGGKPASVTLTWPAN